jgi:hypothetical protein
MAGTITLKNCVASATFCFQDNGVGTRTVTYCISTDATADDLGGAGNQINKTAASLFVNAAGNDLRAKTGSSLIDAGVDLSGTFTTDILGNARPKGSAYDIGAFEATPTASVSGNGNVITDGDATPSGGDFTAFGSVANAAAAVSKTYVVSNTGVGTLTISSVTVPTGFAIDAGSAVPGAGTTIAGGATKNLVVNLLTATSGAKSGDITINSDDAATPYNFAISGTVTASNEINVQGNSTTIVDGDATPSTGDHTDFGATAIIGGAGVQKVYTVQNLGDLTLSISSITVPTGFAIDAGSQLTAGNTTITAGASKTLTVNLLTVTAGVKSGDITINSDDSDEAVYNFAITGTVLTAKEIEVYDGATDFPDGGQTQISFGTIDQGAAAASKTLTVSNLGGTTLTISSVTIPAGYAIDAASDIQAGGTTIAASSSKTLILNMLSTNIGIKYGQVVLNSNDDDEPHYTLLITGLVETVGGTVPSSYGLRKRQWMASHLRR